MVKLKLHRLESSKRKVKLPFTQHKSILYQKQGDIAFKLLVKSQEQDEPISKEGLLRNCLTPVPYSIGTTDCYMAKTDK